MAKTKISKEKETYYRVMWNDGDMDMEMFPDFDDDMLEDYDRTDLKKIRKFAKTIKGSWIEKITIIK